MDSRTEKLMLAVQNHHNFIISQGFNAVMTVLIGSQNYELDNENSDIDTFTFIFPSMEELATAAEPQAGEFEVEDGKCVYKDIRIGLNLLKRTSPNSLECFVGKYRVFSEEYRDIFEDYLNDDMKMNAMTHCNYDHMLYAAAGMAHQLTKRSMPAGKRYSHALRLCSMVDTFIDSFDYRYLLELLPRDYRSALDAKRDTDKARDGYYDKECAAIAQLLDDKRDEFVKSEFKKKMETEGLALIAQFQKDLTKRYIQLMLEEEN